MMDQKKGGIKKELLMLMEKGSQELDLKFSSLDKNLDNFFALGYGTSVILSLTEGVVLENREVCIY